MQILKSRASYALVFIGALLVHTWHLTTPSLWWDEAATQSSFRHGWSGIDAITLKLDVVHKLYYQIAYLVRLGFGDSVLALRLPSAIAAALACVAVIELCRQLRLRTSAGYLASVFLCFTPRLLWASGEARSYSMTVLTGILVILVFVLTVRAVTDGAPPRKAILLWVIFTGVFLGGTYLYLYQLLLILPLALLLVIWRSPRQVWLWASGSVLAVLALSVRLVLTAAHQQGQIAWNRLLVGSVPGLLGSQAFTYLIHPLVIFLAVIVTGVGFGLRRGRSRGGKGSKEWSALILGAVWILGPSLALMSAAFFGEQLYNSRYVSFTLGGWAVLFAAAVSLMDRRLVIGGVALLLIVAPELSAFPGMRTTTAYGSDWGIAAAKLERVAKPGDAAIFGDAWHYPLLRVSVMEAGYPKAFDGLEQIGVRRDPTLLLDDRTSWHKMTGHIDGYRMVWLILDSRADMQEIARATRVLGATGYVEGSVVKAPYTWLVPFRKQVK